MNEKILKVVFVLTVIAVGLYFTYPELSEAQKISYAKSYGITLILTSGGIVIGIALGFMLAFLKFLNNKCCYSFIQCKTKYMTITVERLIV